MPEESKKNVHKNKNEPKDQRRRRQGRHPAGPVEKKPEKQPERQTEKPLKENDKPAYEPPGPEFYKNLKRETDEILKITEEASTKYKKKEIQSNWAKYEMPVESYEEIDEQENMGADYEKLIQAPASAGGHFQFKHEKSWDNDTGPSQYDKYFDINMDLLSLALSTIPFYERNGIEQTMFNENDIATMNHRATKFKHKYYNDKKYSTPELEAQENILKNLASHSEDSETINHNESNDACKINENFYFETSSNITVNNDSIIDINKEKDNEKVKPMPVSSQINEKIENDLNQVAEIKLKQENRTCASNDILTDDEILFGDGKLEENKEVNTKPDIEFVKVDPPKEDRVNEDVKPTAHIQKATAKETPKNPVIESPEDLEKWLDDFLDG